MKDKPSSDENKLNGHNLPSAQSPYTLSNLKLKDPKDWATGRTFYDVCSRCKGVGEIQE